MVMANDAAKTLSVACNAIVVSLNRLERTFTSIEVLLRQIRDAINMASGSWFIGFVVGGLATYAAMKFM